jgi:hypothetical protein
MRRHLHVPALCAGLLIGLAVSCSKPRHVYAASLSALLGDDLPGARIVAVRDSRHVVTIDLATLKEKDLASFADAAPFNGLSSPQWSPDGRQVLFAHGSDCFLQQARDANSERILAGHKPLYAPRFWQDPNSGDLHVLYKDDTRKNRAERGVWGKTILVNLHTGAARTLIDIPCDGGLSLDGTHLGEAYRESAIIELPGTKIHRLHDGQSCNASISPDNAYHLMFLYLPHDHFGIKNKYGKELFKIEKPAGSQEWQSPRFSNHPDFATAVAKFGSEYKLAIIHLPSERVCVLKDLAGDWGSPMLWLASGRTAAAQREKRGSAIAGAQALRLAREALDPRQAAAIYAELITRDPHGAAAEQARVVLDSPAFLAERAAWPVMKELLGLTKRLRPVAGRSSEFKDTDFFERNRAILIRMIKLVATLRAEHPETRQARAATGIAKTYGLPQKTNLAIGEPVELVATITAVSKVPTAQQIAPYRESITFILYAVGKVIAGEYTEKEILVGHWGMRNSTFTAAAGWKPGLQQRLRVDAFDSHPPLARITLAADVDDGRLTPYWVLAPPRKP